MTKAELIKFLEPFDDEIKIMIVKTSLTYKTIIPIKCEYHIDDKCNGYILID